MTIRFVKMHGAANDFVVIDRRPAGLDALSEDLLLRLCDRRRGIGADGVLLLEADPEHDFAMRYVNADGRPAEYCGNGARCLARLALELGLGRDGEVRFRTAAGVQRAKLAPDGRRIELAFGRIAAPAAPVTVEAAGRRFPGRRIAAGVPHFVTQVESVDRVRVVEWGRALRHHPSFGGDGANVDFVTPLGDGRVAMRTYERGVEAETLACGSGAMAVAAWRLAEGGRSPVSVLTAGGDVLVVRLDDVEGGWNATLIGPAEVAFRGEWIEPGVSSS